MSKNLVLLIAVCTTIFQAVSAQGCRTNSDCRSWLSTKNCCGGSFGETKRTCKYGNCRYRYCDTDSDCSNPTLCCRSNECVENGCSGCTSSSDCSIGQYCCKKTFPLSQTVCGASCINESCNSNDDCGGYGECCRSNKCVYSGYLGCNGCTDNSECNFGQYCCKKVRSWYGNTGTCSESCEDHVCGSDDDCGGPGECCRSNKCVKRGCSGCTSNADCSSGHYCCKKRKWYEQSECAAHCIGKSCRSSDDCGGPGESCHAINNICTSLTAQTRTEKRSNGLPVWSIAVIVVSSVVLLIFVSTIVLVFFWRHKRMQPAATTTSNQSSERSQNAGLPQRNEPHVQNSSQNDAQPHANVDLNNPLYNALEAPNMDQNTEGESMDHYQVPNTADHDNRVLHQNSCAFSAPSRGQENPQFFIPPYNPQYVSARFAASQNDPPPPYVN